ncbi:hypothetical protein [Alteromonas sp. CYL-A6]|uniref:hypothetical protein n=1 Tax=Alteromonas nitratireducens TaxID=3390813 RepID=UPI0034B58466
MSLHRHLRVALGLGAILAATGVVAQEEPALSQPDVVPCVSVFHDVVVPDDATQCQIFDDELPASMVFFSPRSNDEVIAYYTDAMPALIAQAPVSERTLLVTEDGMMRVVVSPDAKGSQVDILVAGH